MRSPRQRRRRGCPTAPSTSAATASGISRGSRTSASSSSAVPTRRFRSCRGRRRCTTTTSRTKSPTTRRASACRPAARACSARHIRRSSFKTATAIIVIFEGGAHVWREIHMDGRPLPKREELNPTYFGYSVGRWDGDTLVVETTGFNEKTWLNFNGAMHTDELRTVERITRPNRETLHYEATITDPGAYSRAVDDRVGHPVARGRRARRIHLPGEQPVLAGSQGRLRQPVLRGRARRQNAPETAARVFTPRRFDELSAAGASWPRVSMCGKNAASKPIAGRNEQSLNTN